jgi:hypothetical protein
MSDFITHYELGFDNDDFDFEIIEIGKDYYDHLSPQQPRQITKVRVNKSVFEMETTISDVSFLEFWGYDKKTIDNAKQKQIDSVKFEAILKYVNSKKINNKCGD